MRDIPTSPRIIEIIHNRRIRKIRLSIFFSLLFISFILALAFFSGNKNIVINKILITGTHVINQEKIEAEILKDISGKYLYLFSRNNSFIYPYKKIYNNLILNFPRIESLSIYREGVSTLHVDISERIGSYLYCGAKIPENKEEIGENCYFINNDGFIFDSAPYFSGNVYFKYYINLGDNINPLGKQMIEVDKFHKLTEFIEGIVSLGLKPVYITIDQDNTNHLYLNHGIDDTVPEIIFKNDDNFEVLEENLSLAIKKKEFAEEINSKYNTLLYIDLRFENKVLYKFQ
jgi:hypothetical protein